MRIPAGEFPDKILKTDASYGSFSIDFQVGNTRRRLEFTQEDGETVAEWKDLWEEPKTIDTFPAFVTELAQHNHPLGVEYGVFSVSPLGSPFASGAYCRSCGAAWQIPLPGLVDTPFWEYRNFRRLVRSFSWKAALDMSLLLDDSEMSDEDIRRAVEFLQAFKSIPYGAHKTLRLPNDVVLEMKATPEEREAALARSNEKFARAIRGEFRHADISTDEGV